MRRIVFIALMAMRAYAQFTIPLSHTNNELDVNVRSHPSAPLILQKQSGTTGSTGKTVTVVFSSSTRAGSTLLAACGGSNFASSSWTATITDTLANTWTQDILASQSTTQFAAIFRAPNNQGGGDTLTLTIAGANSANESLACYGYEMLGAFVPATALDQTNTGSNAGSTAPSAGAVTPTVSNEIAITAIAAGATSTPTITPGANWILDSGTLAPASGSLTFGAESMPVTSVPAALTGNATLSASNAWAAAIATYKVFTPPVQIVSPLPTGTNVIGSVNQGTSPWIVAGGGTAGSAATGVVTVQGIASMTKLLVTPDSVALPANQSVNISQINAVTPLMGNGTTGTGSQRVTIASDNTAFSVNATLSAETTKVIGTARLLGNGGATLDSAPQATAPTNGLAIFGAGVNAEQTAATNGQAQRMVTDLVGKLITLPYANPENFVNGTTAAVTDTTSTSVIASAGGSLRNYLTECTGTNSHATVGTFIKILDGSTIIYEGYAAAAGGGFAATFPTPLRGTAATAVNAQAVTTGANFIVSCSGYKGL